MAGKKKGKKAKKQEKTVDEYQLRRDLREETRMAESADLVHETVPSAQDELQNAENIRIGGIEG